MEDLLKEVIEEQAESLKKYKNKNIRTKNITFFPINSTVESKSDISIIFIWPKPNNILTSALLLSLRLDIKVQKPDDAITEQTIVIIISTKLPIPF